MAGTISRFPGASLLLWLLVAITAPSGVQAAGELPPPAKRKVDFAKDIRPLLTKHCLACHGAKKQESGLRFDTRTKTLAGGDRGVSFEIGNSSESLLVRYIAGLDPDITMPPEGDQLSKTEVGLFRAWIDQGAKWPAGVRIGGPTKQHWAFSKLVRPEPPALPKALAVHARSPIDAFILKRLTANRLSPSPAADRYMLARRLSLDLLGLPPSPQEVDRFVADKSPRAYERLVDRLLKSRHFGERWGRHWLDKARYADSDGYEKDRPRPNAWRWRDWVIEAINRDMPFDQFTIEQIAGDLLPAANPGQQLATAFHRQTLTNTEGGTDKEQWRIEAVFDRVETTGTVWLGLTMVCARCHSHKYDPIAQREYYQVFSFFNNGDETNTKVSTSTASRSKFATDLVTYKARVAKIEAALATARKASRPALTKWIAQQSAQLTSSRKDPIRELALTGTSASGSGKTKLTIQKDNAFLVSGANPDKATYTIVALLPASRLTGLRLQVQTDKSLPSNGPGRASNGNFVVSGLQIELSADKSFSKPHQVKLVRPEASFTQKGFPASAALDGKSTTGWAVVPQTGKAHSATFFLSSPQDFKQPHHIRITIAQSYGGKHTLGRFRLVPLTGSRPGLLLPKPVIAALDALSKNSKDAKSREVLAAHFATVDKATAPLAKQLAELKKTMPKPPLMDVRIIRQRIKDPRTTFILHRGDFLQPQKDTPIAAGGIGPLPPVKNRAAKPKVPADRLDLARWLVSDENPLSPRVAVNHIWSHLFGRGLVATPNDFGVRGEKPTHPRLLDWLATEYRRLKWSRKALIRSIVLSSSYRQTSRATQTLAKADPQNRWLGRQNRVRLEAEIVRDNSLAASGLLSRKIGGPSVFPPMPADVAAVSYANNFKWKTSTGEDRYRRGMYTFFKRTAPHPNLTAFDCPDSNTTCVERRASNTPLQALTTLNNEVYVEASRALARRVLDEQHSNDPGRLSRAFQLCVTRPAAAREIEGFADLLVAARTWYQAHGDDAKKLVGSYTAKSSSAEELAAWVATCRIMLNMDEFITRE
ncbi:MAG: hypothetical protein CMJ65_09595 [Planctomycetaceae bacterium]|nr:hypothetical protein [Planctomycetaceae bacterium]